MKVVHKSIIFGLMVLLTGGSYGYLNYVLQAPVVELSVAPQMQTDRYILMQGVAIPVRYAALALPVTGIIAETPVRTGEEVKAGQLLLRLENGEAANKLRRAQADLAQAEAILLWAQQNRAEEITSKQAALAAAQAELNRARTDWQRMEQLQASGAVSRQQADQSYAAYMKSKADAQTAQYIATTAPIGNSIDTILPSRQAAVESSRAYVEEMQSLVKQSEIYAPFEGTVAFINARVGEYQAAAVPVVLLGDYSKWQIQIDDVTEDKAVRIKPGVAATVTFEAIPGLEIPGRVAVISSYGEKKPNNGAYQVVIELSQQDSRIHWNMTAMIKINPE